MRRVRLRRAGLRTPVARRRRPGRRPGARVARRGAGLGPRAARRVRLRGVPRRRPRRPAPRALRPRRALPRRAARLLDARHRRRPVDDGHEPDLARHRPHARVPRPGRLHRPHPRHRHPAQPPLLGRRRRPPRVAAPPDGVRDPGRGRRQRHGRQQARVPRLRAHGRVVPRRDLRRRRQGGGAHRRSGHGVGRDGPRSPTSTTATSTGPVTATGVASSQWLQQLAMVDARGRAAARGAARRPPARRRRRPRHGRLARREPGRRRRPRRADSTASPSSAARRGSATSYCRGGAVDDVLATWREFLGDRADVLSRAEAVQPGLVRAGRRRRVAPRLGDVLVAARGDLGVFSTERFAYEKTLVGLHGTSRPTRCSSPSSSTDPFQVVEVRGARYERRASRPPQGDGHASPGGDLTGSRDGRDRPPRPPWARGDLTGSRDGRDRPPRPPWDRPPRPPWDRPPRPPWDRPPRPPSRAQPNGSGSGARLTAWARAAVSRRRWCWRHSTS